MTEAIIIHDVRMYPDGKLYELECEITDPDDQNELRAAKGKLDFQHWSNIKTMLEEPQYASATVFVSEAGKFKVVTIGDGTAWIEPDDGASISTNILVGCCPQGRLLINVFSNGENSHENEQVRARDRSRNQSNNE